MRKSLSSVLLAVLLAAPCLADSRQWAFSSAKKQSPPRSLQEAGVKLLNVSEDVDSSDNFVAATGISTVTTTKGFSIVSSASVPSCVPVTVAPILANLYTATVRTGDAQDRLRVSFSGLAEISTGVADGLYVSCTYTVNGGSTMTCPTVHGYGLVLTSTTGVGVGTMAAWSTILTSGITPNSEVTVKVDIVRLKTPVGGSGGSVCGSTLIIER